MKRTLGLIAIMVLIGAGCTNSIQTTQQSNENLTKWGFSESEWKTVVTRSSLVGKWRVSRWIVDLNEIGTLSAYHYTDHATDSGKWEYNGDKLILKWNKNPNLNTTYSQLHRGSGRVVLYNENIKTQEMWQEIQGAPGEGD